MTDNTLSTETSGDSFSAAEAAYFSSRGEDTSGLDSASPQDGAGSPPSDAPTNGQTPASGQETAGNDPDDELGDGETIVILDKNGKPRNQNGEFVSHKTFHAIREKYKSTREELLATKQNFARADERLKVLNDVLGQAEQPAATQGKDAEAPDPERDPIGYIAHLSKELAALKGQLAERDKQTNERDTVRAMQSAYQNDAMAYMKEQPEFRDAYGYLIAQRHAELEAIGYTDKAARDRAIAQEERQIVAQALEGRKSPSQMLHKLAIARGFQAKPAAPAADPSKLDPMAKIDALAKAQATAGASLSGAGGSSGEGLTRESLANMSESEFAEVANKLGKAKMRQLMGG